MRVEKKRPIGHFEPQIAQKILSPVNSSKFLHFWDLQTPPAPVNTPPTKTTPV
ncbi:hypothetical protein PsAD26_04117 [Pseudovibrio sp. Ad26]|nr:hypothetical protein PsAD26_04117 [Pseudovibrio sp. Ad26]